MKKNNLNGWLYLLPAILFLGAFMVYPLIDVFVYSLEEGYNSASQSFSGVGLYNYRYVLRDPYFLQALKNTFLMVVVTVPLSTGLALLISVGLSSIKRLRELYQTVYFLPYVTNTLAVGLVFMILFRKTPYSDGLMNALLSGFGLGPVDFIDGPYAAKPFVLCFYTIWVVLPFKILILTNALASVKADYYKAALIGPAPLAARFAADVRSYCSNFGLMVDLSHFPTTYETSKFVIQTLRPYITHFHIGNAVVHPGCEAYGDLHPRFGFPESANDTPELVDFFQVLRQEGFLNAAAPYVLSFEVKPWKDEDEELVLAGTKRVVNRAWALAE